MKKVFTMVLVALATMTASAQSFNFFPASDVDADGWLWLNTQEKIEKYVGLIDEDNYTVDPNGKIIQMAFANITPDYPETYADPAVLGADAEGYVDGDEQFNAETALKGGIVLAPASGSMSMNGGCLVLNLPSCATISLYISSEARMMGRTLMLTPGEDMSIDDSDPAGDPWTGSTKAIYVKASVFSSIHAAGQFVWEGIEKQNNSNNEGVTFQSNAPVYFALQNCNRYPVYVHAIKVTTPKQETTGIKEIATDNADATVYNLAGQRIKAASKGLYVKKGKKFLVK